MTDIKLDFAGNQDVGKRENQQDDFLLLPVIGKPHLVCLLADGMGGHAAGEIASKLAVKTFADEVERIPLPAYRVFEQLLEQANLALAREVSTHHDYEGMGCTFVALEVIGNEYRWISIGDSPLYLLRDGVLKRQNADHSMAGRLDAAAKAGEISWEEARNSPNRHALLYALTGEVISRIDCPREARRLNENDWLILASDGLNTLPDAEIVAVIEGAAPSGAKAVVDALLEAVSARGHPSQDNTSIIAVNLKHLPSEAASSDLETDHVVTRPILAR